MLGIFYALLVAAVIIVIACFVGLFVVLLTIANIIKKGFGDKE